MDSGIRENGMRAAICCSLLLLVCVLLCLPTTRGYFVSDDFGYLQLFHDKPLAHFLRLGDTSEGIFGFGLDEMRPLFGLAWKLDYVLHGTDAAGYHLTNIALHGLSSCLVFLIALAVAGGRWWTALTAGLLFAVAPVHAEAICWVTGRTDSLPVVFYLAGLLCFIRFRLGGSSPYYALSLLAMGLGLLVKEILLTLPFMLIAYDILLGGKSEAHPPARPGGGPLSETGRSLLVHLPFFAVAAAFLGLRWLAFGGSGREHLVGAHAVARFWAEQDDLLRWLFTPFAGQLRGSPGPRDLLLTGCVLAIGLTSSLPLLRARSRDARTAALVLYFGIVWYAITILPLMVTSYRAPRHLYLTSAGIAIALAAVVVPPSAGADARPGLPRLGAAALLVLVYGTTLASYNAEWTAAGAISRKVRADMERLAEKIPDGAAVIVLDVPPRVPGGFGEIRLWEFALPFALQKPFASRDVYSALRILEPPAIYCCPTASWWNDKQPLLASLSVGPEAESIDLYVMRWNTERGAVALSRGRVTKAFVATEIGRTSAGSHRARRLLEALAGSAEASPD